MYKLLDEIKNCFEAGSALWGGGVFVSVIAVSIYYLSTFVSMLNSKSRIEIDRLSANGKYIRNLYTEIDSVKESLRYFIYGTRWTKKLIYEFNNSIVSEYKKNIKNFFGISIELANNLTYCEVKYQLESFLTFIKKGSWQDGVAVGMGDLDYYVENTGAIEKKTLQSLSLVEAAQSKAIMVVGAAGNGKTNLLCSFSELVIALKNPCIFIESRSIKKSCVVFFKDYLEIPWFLNFDCAMAIINFNLKLVRKKFYIVIDAINENDSREFKSSILDFDNLISKYDSFRIVYSCRSELFAERFAMLFGDNKRILVRHIVNGPQFGDAASLMLARYKDHFHFHGDISRKVEAKLLNSLILMRIFFEVYKNSNQKISNLHVASLYNKYIKHISDSCGFDATVLLGKIISVMIDKKLYDDVEDQLLELNGEDKEMFKTLVDNNLILARKSVQEEGMITERFVDVVYFPFDELRDYCIARFLLVNNRDDFEIFFSALNYIFMEKSSPVEGVARFAYIYFRDKKHYECCYDLLCVLNRALFETNLLRAFHSKFDTIIMVILYDYFEELIIFEKDFIVELTVEFPSEFDKLLVKMINNEFEGVSPALSMLADLFDGYNVEKEILRRLSKSFYRLGHTAKQVYHAHKENNIPLPENVRMLMNLLINNRFI